jgi:hypothetical protein
MSPEPKFLLHEKDIESNWKAFQSLMKARISKYLGYQL